MGIISSNPTAAPTDTPTNTPTVPPSHSPSNAPSSAPSYAPSTAPTYSPSTAPTHCNDVFGRNSSKGMDEMKFSQNVNISKYYTELYINPDVKKWTTNITNSYLNGKIECGDLYCSVTCNDVAGCLLAEITISSTNNN